MKTSHRGFTLIELLVAITIMAIVAVLGWRGLDTIVRSRVSLNQELDQTRGLQLAFAQMQSDTGHIAKVEDIGRRPVLSVQAGRLTLVRMVFAENQPSRVQVVAYRIEGGLLTRRESIPTRDLKELDTAWLTALGDTATVPAVTLHASIDAMIIRSWVDREWRPAGMEGGTGPGGATIPPTGLEVSLRVRGSPENLVKIFLLGAA
ncbi:PulJ/GspJ family protein [Noviherbaspirillum denitrificans]|uniref:Type II secretory pathway component PulJ n=1 Tax=Noviherbaspirillum denitrificans TaxID=1968433 RepID=A0A254T8B2_9BURK|nr:prepilin-type N-terminal cleavage/methylation domain-containing protein [Noviherbaspirillum denitrificans]OWW18891.1 type II secretory pathway component PulJ [Noviherbaspirillum denitrificans]